MGMLVLQDTMDKLGKANGVVRWYGRVLRRDDEDELTRELDSKQMDDEEDQGKNGEGSCKRKLGKLVRLKKRFKIHKKWKGLKLIASH